MDWIANRGGVVVWRTQDLSNLDRGDMYAPLRTAEGGESPRPHWAYAQVETVTDIARFKFAKLVECGRCRIALNRRIENMRINLTPGSTNRVRAMQHKLEEQHKTDIYYHFVELEAVFEKAEWDVDTLKK